MLERPRNGSGITEKSSPQRRAGEPPVVPGRAPVRPGNNRDVPGGTGIMIVFMIGFSLSSLAAVWFIRNTFHVLKNMNYAILIALVAGHILGFCAWGLFVYFTQKNRARSNRRS